MNDFTKSNLPRMFKASSIQIIPNEKFQHKERPLMYPIVPPLLCHLRRTTSTIIIHLLHLCITTLILIMEDGQYQHGNWTPSLPFLNPNPNLNLNIWFLHICFRKRNCNCNQYLKLHLSLMVVFSHHKIRYHLDYFPDDNHWGVGMKM